MHLRAALIALFAAIAPAAASAASLDRTLDGPALFIDTPRAQSVEIVPDATLRNQVVVHATADQQGELDQLILESRDGARVRSRQSSQWHLGTTSWHMSLGETPTLALRISVPPGFAIAIDEGGAGHYTIGRIAGSLNLDISGAADIAADQATPLKAELSGPGSISVAHVSGSASIDMSGHGTVSLGEAKLDSLSASLSGAGRLSVSGGHIDSVALDESGFGDIEVGAEAGRAKVDISGAGHVHFTRVLGGLQKDVSGLGQVTVGE